MRRTTFISAAILLVAGAAVHVAAYLAGPAWLATLGAPPSVIDSARDGGWLAPAGTFAIAALLAVLAAYCLGGAGIVRRLPMTRSVLILFATIFVLRGLLVGPVLIAGQREWITPLGRFVANGTTFVEGSLVVLAIGVLMAIGIVARAHPASHGAAPAGE